MLKARADLALVAVLLAAQVTVGYALLDRRAQGHTLTPPPTREVALASALGDGEFFFRNGLLKLLNLGVTGGKLVPMKELDYDDLTGWFYLLDSLDPRSFVVPYLASYWYGFTPKTEDSRYVIDYLLARAAFDAKEGWRWRVQAMFFAKHRLGDLELALAIAEDLAASDDPEAPYWVEHMPAFMLESLGETEAALILLMSIMESKPEMSDDERFALQIAIDRLIEEPSGETQ